MNDPVIRGAVCKRCDNGFRYIKRPGRGRPRLYCEPCVELEQIDTNRFHNLHKKARAA